MTPVFSGKGHSLGGWCSKIKVTYIKLQEKEPMLQNHQGWGGSWTQKAYSNRQPKRPSRHQCRPSRRAAGSVDRADLSQMTGTRSGYLGRYVQVDGRRYVRVDEDKT